MTTTERDLQRWMALGASVCILGLALVGVRATASAPISVAGFDVASELGALVVLAGLIVLMACIHRYGRLGVSGARKSRER
jgi:hypothetical protein